MLDIEKERLFSFKGEARYWNELYDKPATYFDHVMVQRRDYAEKYICSNFPGDAKVLDLGCGAGVLSERLLESGFGVTAVDLSADMLALAGERLSRFPSDTYRLRRANCLHLPFEDAEFDVVVCLGMIGYIEEGGEALQEMRRVLRRSGTLILTVRNLHTHHVFDLAQLWKLPLRLARALYRDCVRRIQRSRQEKSGNAKREELAKPFRLRTYQSPLALIRGVTDRGFLLIEFSGLGYGPIAFRGNKLLSQHASIRFSDAVQRGISALRLNRLGRWCADVNFFIFKRTDLAIERHTAEIGVQESSVKNLVANG